MQFRKKMPFTPKAVKGTGEGIEVPMLNLINRIARLADQPGGLDRR
jgi:hypothetical protein